MEISIYKEEINLVFFLTKYHQLLEYNNNTVVSYWLNLFKSMSMVQSN